MIYRRAQEYIIAYKLMIHKKTPAGLGIDLFTHISIEIIYNMVKYFKTQTCELDFDIIFIDILEK